VAWVLELTYSSVGALRVEIDTQLGEGGLFLDTAVPSDLPQSFAVLLRLCAPETEPIEVACELGERTLTSIYLELDDESSAALRERAAGWARAAAEAPTVRFVAPEADSEAVADSVSDSVSDSASDSVADSVSDPATDSVSDSDSVSAGGADAKADPELTLARRIAVLSIGEKIQLAHNGARDARMLLARDRAGAVQCGLVRNPRVTVDEMCALARGAALSPDTAEALAQHPSFGSSPAVALALVRNPKTPLQIATQMVQKLLPSDLRTIAKGVGVRAQVAAAARKRVSG